MNSNHELDKIQEQAERIKRLELLLTRTMWLLGEIEDHMMRIIKNINEELEDESN